MNRLISDSYLQALKENDLSPVDMPNITNISPLEKDAPLNFTAVVEVRPKIDLGTYEGIEVKENARRGHRRGAGPDHRPTPGDVRAA